MNTTTRLAWENQSSYWQAKLIVLLKSKISHQKKFIRHVGRMRMIIFASNSTLYSLNWDFIGFLYLISWLLMIQYHRWSWFLCLPGNLIIWQTHNLHIKTGIMNNDSLSSQPSTAFNESRIVCKTDFDWNYQCQAIVWVQKLWMNNMWFIFVISWTYPLLVCL